MNTAEITHLIGQDLKLTKIFLGVFPSDKLPPIKGKRQCLIANTDDSSQPGQHWVAFYADKNGTIEYFDSFGREPYIDSFIDYLKMHDTESVRFNARHLQNDDSMVCGIYCLYYLYYKARGVSLKRILKAFSRNYHRNDITVCSFLYEKFHVRLNICDYKCKYNQTCKSLNK